MDWEHDKLAEDLAIEKGVDFSFLDVQLGSPWLQGSVGRADLVNINPSYTKFIIDMYEVKVTRADFLQDVKKGKYKRYLDKCNRLYFAVPKGLIKKEEVPEECGLIVRGDKYWKVVKQAPKRPEEVLDFMMILSILFAKKKRPLRQRNLDRRLELRSLMGQEYWHLEESDYKKIKAKSKDMGKRVQEAIINEAECKMEKFKYERMRYELKEILEEAEEASKRLFRDIKLHDPDFGRWLYHRSRIGSYLDEIEKLRIKETIEEVEKNGKEGE